MNAIGDALGELCKIILPIRPESYPGNPESAVAVCTLSDIALLGDLASEPAVRAGTWVLYDRNYQTNYA